MIHKMGDGKNAYKDVVPYKKICAFCGKEFEAKKASTRYCSHACSQHAYKKRKRDERRQAVQEAYVHDKKSRELDKLSEFQYMSPTAAAKFLGVGRMTIYRYLHSGFLDCIVIGNLIRISKESLIEAGSQKGLFLSEETASGYVSVKQLSEELQMPYITVYRIVKVSDLKCIRKKCIDLYPHDESVSFISNLREESHPEIRKWYTCKEVQKKFLMTEAAVYSLAHEYDIPRRSSGRTVYYSQVQIDAVMEERRGKVVAVHPKYYTTGTAMETYGMNEEQVRRLLKEYKIETKVISRMLHFKRSDFDAIFGIPKTNP